MRIGLLGQFGSGNSGNDGSLEAMLALLRKACPEAKLLCICTNPEIVGRMFDVPAVSISSPPNESRFSIFLNRVFFHLPRRLHTIGRAFSVCRHLDVMIVPGTGILDDFNEGPFGWPFVILRWFLAARLCGTKRALVCIGAGPIHHPLSRFFLKLTAQLAQYRSFRDPQSRAFMRSIGLDTAKDRVFCDLAFRLPAPDRTRDDGAVPIHIGLGVMAYSGWEKKANGDAIYTTYLQKMADLIEWLLQQGMVVRILTGDHVDRRAVKDVLALVSKSEQRLLAEEADTLHEVMRQLADTDIVVTTRYHNVICALQTGRPTISLGYADKNDVLLTRAGLGAFCHHIETFDPDLLKEQILSVLFQRIELEQAVHQAVTSFHAQLVEQEAILGKQLFGARHRSAHREADA